MRGLDPASQDLVLVPRMNPIDECSVPFCRDVEIVAKRSVSERIDDFGEGKKELKRKFSNEQRQNVLGANSLKSCNRTIPVKESFFLPPQLSVVSVTPRKLRPEFTHDLQGLGPSLVTIPAYHVGDDKGRALP